MNHRKGRKIYALFMAINERFRLLGGPRPRRQVKLAV